ncbi:MAG: hypothetical protein LBV70_06500, partial [Candidatus Adiutrix sp.]|nr:hypothetical protein [Candidatus Adiutrix sp.]
AAIPLLSAALPPLLEKAWGGRKPELIIRAGRNTAPGKLDSLRTAPDLQELQAVLPGEFIEFRPARPDGTAEPAGDDEEAEALTETPDSDDD